MICILLSAFVGLCIEFIVTVTSIIIIIIIINGLILINGALCRRVKTIKEPETFL